MVPRLGQKRCSQIDEEGDIPLLSSVTGLGEKAVRKRLVAAHGNALVHNVFEQDWPWQSAALGALTVAVARRANLDLELSATTGLGKRAVGNRLRDTRGNTLLLNAFPQMSVPDAEPSDVEDDDDDPSRGERPDYLDGRSKFATVDLLAVVTSIAVRDAVPFIDWLASRIGVSGRLARKRLHGANGRTLLRNLFADRWPPGEIKSIPVEALGAIEAGAARRSHALVRVIAEGAQVSARAALAQLENAEASARVDHVLASFPGAPEGRDPPQPSPPEEPIVARRWRLGRLLGKGGFGAVYEADRIHPPHGRVVIKLELPGSPESLKNEIGIAYDLTHQNICAYKEYGLDRAFGTYLVLQHGGESLDRMIQRFGDVGQATDVIEQAARGIDYAHKHGVIHHDIKPQNILVDQRGEVRVTDFGIALQGTVGPNTAGKTTVFGTSPNGLTFSYAAPEQILMEKPRKASDQYSLALVFCSMLEGRVFTQRYTLRKFGRLTGDQNTALKRALSLDPEHRFPSCREFVSALTHRTT